MDNLSYDLASEAIERLDLLEIDYNASKELIATLRDQLSTASNQIVALQNAIANITPFSMSILDDYAKKVQTISTSTVYVDKENGKAYKMYTVNNILALEEVDMPSSIPTNN